jgi:2-polyprenyl-3-methyl-5-hydroxy-6-metoxy-1,4-benzoquinol methylase
MANFKPMKQRFLLLLEDNLRLLSLGGRFLDYGCGSGDVSEYLVRHCRMPAGTAYDPALSDAEIDARKRGGTPGLEHANRAADLETGFDFAVLFDVIEHVPDAPGALQELHGLVRDDGWLIVTVPYNRYEWGIDDLFYGHLRRLSRRGVISLLENNGWDVVRTLDPTFPTFWLIRRAYLLATRFSKTLRARHEAQGSDLERTFASSKQSSWQTMGPIPRLLSSVLVPWKLIRLFDLYFESVFLGFELFVVAQRRTGDHVCEVCRNGSTSHHRFFERYSRQVCGYCQSELMLPRLEATRERPAKRPPPWVRRVQRWLRGPRTRKLLRTTSDLPERSAIDVRSRDPGLLRRLEGLGWKVRGTEPAAGLELDERFGMATLFHVVEHVDDLQAALAEVDRRILPGGYLVLEYPSARSWIKKLLGSRWFGYDPPHHRLLINPVFLSDRLGLAAFRLIREDHFSPEYSYFIFAQSLANALLPFQRDGLYRMLSSRPTSPAEKIGAALSLPVFVVSAILYPIYQPLASLCKRGCVVLQIFKKADLG